MNKQKTKSPRFFIISDTHFFHEEVIAFWWRKKGFEEEIIRKWNNTINPEDFVYHLWDVSFGQAHELPPIIKRLNGTKILIRGNHDKKSISYYMRSGFTLAVDEIRINSFFGKNIILSHIPLKKIDDDYINVHGHLHSGYHRSKEIYSKDRGYYLYNPEKEGYNLMPVLLKNHIK